MILFHGTPAKFGPRKATGRIDSKMQKSIGSKMPYLEFGIHRLQGKLDPGADISPQTKWKNGNLDPESEEAF
jgi:hypothetical protein